MCLADMTGEGIIIDMVVVGGEGLKDADVH